MSNSIVIGKVLNINTNRKDLRNLNMFNSYIGSKLYNEIYLLVSYLINASIIVSQGLGNTQMYYNAEWSNKSHYKQTQQ